MVLMSESMHRYVQAKVDQAIEILDDASRGIPSSDDYTNFDDARTLLRNCRDTLTPALDIDAVAQSLRKTVTELRELCGGPAEAAVNAAVGLLDQAIGGETM
jgi:hypothetical protein